MSNKFQNYRNEFLLDNGFYEKIYLPEEEQEKLNEHITEAYGNSDSQSAFEKYSYEVDGNRYKFYNKKIIELTDYEFSQYISMQMLSLTKSMDAKQNTMKNIMIFWVTLTVISLLCSIYVAAKFVGL